MRAIWTKGRCDLSQRTGLCDMHLVKVLAHNLDQWRLAGIIDQYICGVRINQPADEQVKQGHSDRHNQHNYSALIQKNINGVLASNRQNSTWMHASHSFALKPGARRQFRQTLLLMWLPANEWPAHCPARAIGPGGPGRRDYPYSAQPRSRNRSPAACPALQAGCADRERA